jgi:hypothetical protein
VVQRRPLTAADTSLLETFLAVHRDSSMFLRGNVRRARLTYQGLPGEANYAGAFRDGRVVGVAAHCWNGMLLLQAPDHAAELARAAVEWSGRPVTGLSGPLEQVRQARSELDLDRVDVALDGDEWLYALDLSELVVPEPLSNGTVVCRHPRPEERDTLCSWRLAYDIELLGAIDSPSTRQRSEEFLDAQIADGNAWGRGCGRHACFAVGFQRCTPGYCSTGGYLRAAGASRAWFRQSSGGGIAPRGASTRLIARGPVHAEPQRSANLRSDRVSPYWRLLTRPITMSGSRVPTRAAQRGPSSFIVARMLKVFGARHRRGRNPTDVHVAGQRKTVRSSQIPACFKTQVLFCVCR